MGPLSVHDPHVGAKVKEWTAVSNELFIDIELPHSGGSGHWYMVSSLANFNDMVAEAPSGSVLFIVREPQFPIRGIVDEAFIRQALVEIEDGEWYIIARREFYPTPLPYGSGNSHAELEADLEDFRGMTVCVGKEPDLPVYYWVQNDDEDVIVATKP